MVKKAKELCVDLLENVRRQYEEFKDRGPQRRFNQGDDRYNGNQRGYDNRQGGYGGQQNAPVMSPTDGAAPGTPSQQDYAAQYAQYYGQDPYAAYGGYQNYMAMYYQYYQQQQGAAGQQSPPPPGADAAAGAPPPPPPPSEAPPPPPPGGSPPNTYSSVSVLDSHVNRLLTSAGPATSWLMISSKRDSESMFHFRTLMLAFTSSMGLCLIIPKWSFRTGSRLASATDLKWR